jgi:type VI protein secretion system component Hcp
MRKTFHVGSALLAAGIGLAATAPAIGGSIYLKLPNVTGTSTKSGFSGDIELTAYSQSFTNPVNTGSGGGLGSGREQLTCGAINISKLVDLASQNFLEYVTRGTLIHTATVYFTAGNANTGAATTRYTIVLTNVRVTSVTQGDTAADTAGLGITENISMIADKFQVTYSTSSVDSSRGGNTESYGWDCVSNTPT